MTSPRSHLIRQAVEADQQPTAPAPASDGRLKALFDSLVRTYVPWLAGVIVGWLVSLGIPLDPEVEVQVTLVLMGAASVLWYVLGRIFELYVSPKLGWLVGLPKQPTYEK